ncbi:hypothetical protein OIU84_015469 [Salix udensis]|uniref:Uncharacterized protein n=1 Tax=Salix udensis TaxID=889485 RepID=A0AAD6JE98_9ROSI|nr:hypothetical protein OIU84_015469 [Salix udensis]
MTHLLIVEGSSSHESPLNWSTMGRNVSPILRQELANLDTDGDSCKSTMKALKSYVEGLDSKANPQFLAEVSDTKETGSLSDEYTISLYEFFSMSRCQFVIFAASMKAKIPTL